ncbi:ribonuclease HII [Bifidobacterium commune]|uniref:Ribonuclease n=1 Tax=Bifidobacterium commune TaxID=1505727 RepID=A0A1C4GZY3_9BIFI|nr:ribonuclease HII [Bifidobacterium commune]MBB2955482.1 ribonuclease HII [Bifidobacterium commune]SCC77940.1 RNase HII [Bifidobacterium commune]
MSVDATSASDCEDLTIGSKRGGSHARITPTLELERELAGQGFDLIIGLDEVGRGALAGPVMVGAAVVWSCDVGVLGIPEGVTDSKLLTEYKREAMFDGLLSWCAASAVGQASNTEIDEWGISYALGIAALRAINEVERELNIGVASAACDAETSSGSSVAVSVDSGLSSGCFSGSDRPRVGAILDGPNNYISKVAGTFDAPGVPILPDVTTKVKADQSCVLVSVASVIAKVTRDRLMVALAQGNPNYAPYQWKRNKGYGSTAHREAIAQYGATPLHRVSWHLT